MSRKESELNTKEMVDSLYAVNRRLAFALGDNTAGWNAAARDQAEHAIEGDVYRSPDGGWTRINFDKLDWNANDTANPAHIVMVLRRFHMLRPLVAGYRGTGEERYAHAARRYIDAFLRDHPPVDNWSPVPGDGDTQYDIRVGVWLEALGELRLSPVFDEPFMARMIQALRGNLRYLSGHVRADRNIRIWHGQVLLLSGIRLATLPEAASWLEQGRSIVNDAVRRQVLPDGAHMEAAPGYHSGVLEIIQTLWNLARVMPELGLHVPAERVAAMHDYQLSTTRPDGVMISLHDTRYAPATAEPSTFFRDARDAFRKQAGLPDVLPAATACFPSAGQVFIRDDWTTASSYLTFDAAQRRSFHWHPSRNSITLFAHGRALLVDPGYTFETDRFPRYGQRTAHHNTVNFNGWDQSQCPAELRTSSASGYTLVEGLYGGSYWPVENSSHGSGIFGEHHRMLLWVRGRFGIVLDHVHHTAIAGQKPSIESCWQFSEGPAECDPAARRAVTRHAHGNLLLTFPVVLPGTKMSLHEGEREPMRGWLPTDWGRTCIAAPLLRVVAPQYDPWHGDMASILIPFAGERPPEVRDNGTGPDAVNDARRAGCLRLDWPTGESDRIVWTRRLGHAIDRQHGLYTDASLVHLRLDASGAVTEGIMVDGTHCSFEGVQVSHRLTGIDRLGLLPAGTA